MVHVTNGLIAYTVSLGPVMDDPAAGAQLRPLVGEQGQCPWRLGAGVGGVSCGGGGGGGLGGG